MEFQASTSFSRSQGGNEPPQPPGIAVSTSWRAGCEDAPHMHPDLQRAGNPIVPCTVSEGCKLGAGPRVVYSMQQVRSSCQL